MKESLYEYISKSINGDGCLPEGFSLPKPENEQKIIFADGAMDGIQIYHSAFTALEDDDRAAMLDLLRLANNGDIDKAEEGFSKLCEKFSAIVIIDDLQNTIMENKEELKVQQMVKFAYKLISGSSDRELVKVGLIILELVDTSSDPDMMRIIRTLGLSDEFTIFAVFVMRHWPNGQMEILDLAKKVRGWGRIHCVRFIEPENDEIKHWLLLNGIDNDVLREYSALDVFEKIDAEDLLDRTDLNSDEAKAVLDIIDAMLVEGPVAGISAVEDPSLLLAKVLRFAGGITLGEKEQAIIKEVTELKQKYDSAE